MELRKQALARPMGVGTLMFVGADEPVERAPKVVQTVAGLLLIAWAAKRYGKKKTRKTALLNAGIFTAGAITAARGLAT